jgi:hypothetical protein
VAFYASDIPAPGLSAIHRWDQPDTGAIRYGASPPPGSYQDMGVAFYAPLDANAALATNASYAPVYRWTKDGADRYGALDLAGTGYALAERTFYAACPDSNNNGLNDCRQSFPYCPDLNGDRVMGIADIAFLFAHYRAPRPEGGVFTIRELAAVLTHFRERCPA